VDTNCKWLIDNEKLGGGPRFTHYELETNEVWYGDCAEIGMPVHVRVSYRHKEMWCEEDCEGVIIAVEFDFVEVRLTKTDKLPVDTVVRSGSYNFHLGLWYACLENVDLDKAARSG
jgi:hypothetical protein